MLRKVARWIDARLHISALYASTAGHTVPASAASWFYVFGSGTLLCFGIQIVTGICLAFVYVPSADEAYTSLTYLNEQQTLGWFLRAIHYWGSITGAPTSWWASCWCTWPRCSCSGPTNTREN